MSDTRTKLIRKMARHLCDFNDDRWSDTAQDGLIYRECAEELLEMVVSDMFPVASTASS